MKLYDLVDQVELDAMLAARYVKATTHPTENLVIYNYTAACQYDRVWNDTTRRCRGLIVRPLGWRDYEVVARPWPKFHNYGEHDAGALDLDAPCYVTDKMDGSLGILYPLADGTYAVATRGSFTSEQAIHATALWRSRYAMNWSARVGCTYLFEIVYPQNRIVLDYGDTDDLVLLAVLDTETGLDHEGYFDWRGPVREEIQARTLAEALALPPRPNAEGVVVTYATGLKVKIKQDDYVALHRIMTHLNARNVWEIAAVRACAHLIKEPKHWGSFLGIDPARAEEVLSLAEDWLDGVPDEFYAWMRDVAAESSGVAAILLSDGRDLAGRAFASSPDRFARFDYIRGTLTPMVTEVMRLCAATGTDDYEAALGGLTLRCWRESCPPPTAPFSRSEDVA